MEPKFEGFQVGDIVEHRIRGFVEKVDKVDSSTVYAGGVHFYKDGRDSFTDKYPAYQVTERPKKKRKVEVDCWVELCNGKVIDIQVDSKYADHWWTEAKLTYEVEE